MSGNVWYSKKYNLSWKVAYFYFQEALKMVKISVDLFYITFIRYLLSWEIIVMNWIDIMNIIFKKQIIQRSYPNIHLRINYVCSFQEICIYFDQPRHPNGWQWPMTGHYLQCWAWVQFLRKRAKQKKMLKMGQIFKNLGKHVQKLKIFWKRAGDCV